MIIIHIELIPVAYVHAFYLTSELDPLISTAKFRLYNVEGFRPLSTVPTHFVNL